MCSLFGYLDYQGIMPHRLARKLCQSLAVAAEDRGTDAAGISYVRDGEIVIYKRPKAAHKLHFDPPEGTRAVMGHTRLTTQGSEKKNQNNHPFYGKTPDISWSLSHNGCLFNDATLRKEKKLPATNIETDSYVAVQLIESQGRLDFDSLRYMAEAVRGSFTFSLLDADNSLYFVKGSNPLCLIHFKDLGIYVYASTDKIAEKALKRVGLHKFAYEQICTDEGDIIKIDKNGNLTRSQFKPAPSYTHFSKSNWWYGNDDFYSAYEETLISMAHCMGCDEEDILLLFDYGYSVDEVEALMMDADALTEAARSIKLIDDECLCEGCY